MLADFLHVALMPNTSVRSVRISAEPVAGENESNCESGHQYLHRSLHFGRCLRLCGIQWSAFLGQYSAQLFAVVDQRNHQIGFRAVGRIQLSTGHLPMQSEFVLVDLSSSESSATESNFMLDFLINFTSTCSHIPRYRITFPNIVFNTLPYRLCWLRS